MCTGDIIHVAHGKDIIPKLDYYFFDINNDERIESVFYLNRKVDKLDLFIEKYFNYINGQEYLLTEEELENIIKWLDPIAEYVLRKDVKFNDDTSLYFVTNGINSLKVIEIDSNIYDIYHYLYIRREYIENNSGPF